jgi:hypothetical protein
MVKIFGQDTVTVTVSKDSACLSIGHIQISHVKKFVVSHDSENSTSSLDIEFVQPNSEEHKIQIEESIRITKQFGWINIMY